MGNEPLDHPRDFGVDQFSTRGRGAGIQRIRRARGLTQSDLAKATGVSRSMVAQWETGRAGHAERDRDIAAALRVTVREVAGYDKEAPPGPTTNHENELLRSFRCLNDHDRRVLVHLATKLQMAGHES